MLLDPAAELSVRTDRVSIEYRRWLRELATAALAGPEAYAATSDATGARASGQATASSHGDAGASAM